VGTEGVEVAGLRVRLGRRRGKLLLADLERRELVEDGVEVRGRVARAEEVGSAESSSASASWS
jgi:hypothetical protein